MPLAELIGQDDARMLLEVARQSISQGLEGGHSLHVDPNDYSKALARPGASFVTLELDDELRGCIGHLETRQPLIQDVSENAYLAAFRDPRFASLTASEYPRIEISISILSPAEPVEFGSQEELLKKIRPGIDGLILKESGRQGTFLPSVWESLPEPADFLSHLKLKSGLPVDYWSDSIRISRYTTQSIH